MGPFFVVCGIDNLTAVELDWSSDCFPLAGVMSEPQAERDRDPTIMTASCSTPADGGDNDVVPVGDEC